MRHLPIIAKLPWKSIIHIFIIEFCSSTVICSRICSLILYIFPFPTLKVLYLTAPTCFLQLTTWLYGSNFAMSIVDIFVNAIKGDVASVATSSGFPGHVPG